MHGWALVLLFGVPCLISALWLGSVAFAGNCIAYIFGVIQCGPSIYLYSFLGVMFFLITLLLAYLWR